MSDNEARPPYLSDKVTGFSSAPGRQMTVIESIDYIVPMLEEMMNPNQEHALELTIETLNRARAELVSLTPSEPSQTYVIHAEVIAEGTLPWGRQLMLHKDVSPEWPVQNYVHPHALLLDVLDSVSVNVGDKVVLRVEFTA